MRGRERKVTPERRERILTELADLEGKLYPWTRKFKAYQLAESKGFGTLTAEQITSMKKQASEAYDMTVTIRRVMWDMMDDVYSKEERLRESHALVERFDERMEIDFAPFRTILKDENDV